MARASTYLYFDGLAEEALYFISVYLVHILRERLVAWVTSRQLLDRQRCQMK